MTVRQAIAKDLCDKIKTISKITGYKTDVTSTDVYHWHVADFIDSPGREIVNVKDLKTLYQGDYQTLLVKIAVGCVKADNNHEFITNRLLDIYNVITNNYSTFLAKYGYWVVDVLDEDDLAIEQLDHRIAETAINLQITYKADEKYQVDNRSF